MRILALLVIVVFMAPDTLLAQSGWILWRKSTTIFEGGTAVQQIPIWAPQDGFDELVNCRGAAAGILKESVAALRASGAVASATVHPGERSATVSDSVSGKRIWELEFVCFPGGFDPRTSAARQ